LRTDHRVGRNDAHSGQEHSDYEDAIQQCINRGGLDASPACPSDREKHGIPEFVSHGPNL
jgi:hypothetical protein